MSTPTLSLKQWFYRNARVPILFSLGAFLGVEVLLLSLVARTQFEHQKGVAERLAELSRLALEEKSTSLLQAGFEIARRDLKASDAFVCEQSLVYVTIPPRLSQCVLEKRIDERVIEVPIALPNRLRTPPFQQHKFVLRVPILPRDELIYFTLGISLVVCLLGVSLLRRLSRRLHHDLFGPLFENLSSGLQIPIQELEEIRQKIVQLGRLETHEAVSRAIINRNLQVAHDIRSPLTALLFASKDFDSLPNSSRGVIRAAVERIQSIVNSLNESPSSRVQIQDADGFCLVLALEELLAEKKMEYSNLENIDWSLEVDSMVNRATLPMQKTELKRALSNLINNSIEALDGEAGAIRLKAKYQGEKLEIVVEDEGKGIEKDILGRVGQKGFSFGKTMGQGLGVSFAKELVEGIGGKFSLESQLNQGTRVQILL